MGERFRYDSQFLHDTGSLPQRVFRLISLNENHPVPLSPSINGNQLHEYLNFPTNSIVSCSKDRNGKYIFEFSDAHNPDCSEQLSFHEVYLDDHTPLLQALIINHADTWLISDDVCYILQLEIFSEIVEIVEHELSQAAD